MSTLIKDSIYFEAVTKSNLGAIKQSDHLDLLLG